VATGDGGGEAYNEARGVCAGSWKSAEPSPSCWGLWAAKRLVDRVPSRRTTPAVQQNRDPDLFASM